MENSNVVPTKLFKFVGISLAFCHEDEGEAQNPADRDKIRSGGYFKFRIVDKDILYLPLVFIPEVNPFIVATTTTTLGAAGGGGQNVAMYKLPIPITLNPYENFNVEMVWDGTVAITKSVDIYVALQGFMRKIFCAIMKRFIMKTWNIGGSLRWLYRGIVNLNRFKARNDHQQASLKGRWYDLNMQGNELAEIFRNKYPLGYYPSHKSNRLRPT